VTLDGPVLGQLPADTKQAIENIVLKSQSRMNELQARAAAAGRQPTSAELAALREQTRIELQSILPPSQLEEFLLRYSQNAAELRSELGTLKYFNASPDEFRALFRARDQFDQKLAAIADSSDPNDIRQRESLEAQRESAIKLALGQRRYALYKQLQDPEYRLAYGQALAAGDATAARTLYEVNRASEAEMARVRANSNMTPEQLAIAEKRVELEQLKATAEAVGQDIPPDPNAPPPPPPAPENRVHTFAPGETLGSISTAYGMPVNAIINANPDLQINALKPGQRIIIPPAPQAPLR
jgi:LysM repeat protein